jgi:hypothetical protein
MGSNGGSGRVVSRMTVSQFLDYLASYPHSRQLAFVLADVLDAHHAATLRRSA